MFKKATHLALLGDSIFDNAHYVRKGEFDVIQHVKKTLGIPATLLAVDGSVIQSVHRQVYKIPPDASHIVISVGGNDALRAKSILYQSVNSVQAAFGHLNKYVETFRSEYAQLMKEVSTLKQKVILCTIYNPCYDDEQMQKVASLGVAVFNDIILRNALEHGWPVIDLRALFTDKADYANPIEPSHAGGAKIAKVIAQVLENHDFEKKYTVLYK